jgi:N6-L-threonylcarbamoyladenine synthase
MRGLREAASRHKPKTIILSGGVACNSGLRAAVRSGEFGIPIYYPSPLLTTDNAAMIAAAGAVRLARGEDDGLEFTATASLKLENFSLEGYAVPGKVRYKT